MTTALAAYLREQIAAQGPISVAQFMEIALGHPQHGYYMKKDPFGVQGDFTTAPEISQMFGEVIGAWAADVWMQMGRPAQFTLLECGPGRGTLMADMLRATKGVEGFHAAARVCLLETSPVLRRAQAEVLKGYAPEWHEALADIDTNYPLIVIANEFLDALPVHQMGKSGERLIGYGAGGFYFTHDEEVFEQSPAREKFVRDLCAMIKKQNGAALFIDYGHVQSAPGDTLQALYRHEYVPVFAHIGDADITAHVDFEALARVVDINVHGPVEQGAFLKALGIESRAAFLQTKAGKPGDVENALHRLTHSDQMGSLFKAMCFSHGKISPAGF